MRFLRSSILAVLVALLFVAGYGHRVLGDCCDGEQTVQTGHQHGHCEEKAPLKTDGCHCYCHTIVFSSAAEPVRVLGAALLSVEVAAIVDELPPEMVPLGIDYPPQLA